MDAGSQAAKAKGGAKPLCGSMSDHSAADDAGMLPATALIASFPSKYALSSGSKMRPWCQNKTTLCGRVRGCESGMKSA